MERIDVKRLGLVGAIGIVVLRTCVEYYFRTNDTVAATLAPLYLCLFGGFFYPFVPPLWRLLLQAVNSVT